MADGGRQIANQKSKGLQPLGLLWYNVGVKSKAALVTLLLLLPLVLTACKYFAPAAAWANVTPGPLVTRTASPQRTAAVTSAVASVEAEVTYVFDGDTIAVRIAGQEARVRYIGIDAPESTYEHDPFGPEATAKNKELVAGKRVRLEKDVSETDRYGRLLRYVYVGDVMVNAELVRLGYAQASSFPPDVRYQALLARMQREARAAGRGLWGLPQQ